MTNAAPSISFDPRSPEYLRDPHAALQEVIRESPVFYSDKLNAYCAASYEWAKHILTNDADFSSKVYRAMPVSETLHDRIPASWRHAGQVIQGRQTINMDPPRHTRHRRALQQAFTHKRARDIQPAVAAIADELIDALPVGGCDVVQDFALQLTLRSVTTMMAVPRDLADAFAAWIKNVFAILAPVELAPDQVTVPDDDLVTSYEGVYALYSAYLRFLEERKANPGADFTSMLLTLPDDDGGLLLDNEDVMAHLVGVTAAGSDTAANLIVHMVRWFTEDPDQLALVRDEPSLWENAVLEGMRRSAIAGTLLRRSTRDTELAGIKIPAGSRIFVVIPAANADPAVFPDPLRFDVRRPNAASHLGFGRGRHRCLGAPLAIPQTQTVLRRLYERLPNLEADLTQELEFLPSMAVRALTSQRVTWSV